jgi:hypothetical protein
MDARRRIRSLALPALALIVLGLAAACIQGGYGQVGGSFNIPIQIGAPGGAAPAPAPGPQPAPGVTNLAGPAQVVPNQNPKSISFEVNTDRPGSDYKQLGIQNSNQVQAGVQCRNNCWLDPQCRAYTYLKPKTFNTPGICFLKSQAPGAVPNAMCISGAKTY